jgi:hypothetical protein
VTRDPERRTEQTRPVGGEAAERLRQFTLLAPGSQFAGRYRIEARIGGGGAGEVYRAFDELSQATVAIKVLFPRGDDPQPLERLRRELRLVRGLSHPGIVRIHDIGEHGGLLFLVMDLLEGETLRARLQRGPLPPDEAAALLAQVLEALAAAHAAGVVHRDVKPGNILLARGAGSPAAAGTGADGAARAVLLDFGLARGGDAPGMTRTGAFLGTPEYVSPEQARGEKSIGPAADVYSAGIVLWEALAGRPPFEGDSQVEILMAHARRPLPPPRRALPAAPGWLRDLAAWMLEKDPARRPADAGAALAFLRRRQRASLGRRWRAAGRARGATARRAALAGCVLLLAAALAAAALLPVGVRIDGREITARSLVRLPIRRAEADLPLHHTTPRFSSFRYLAGLMREPQTPRDVPYLARFDALSGELAPITFSAPEPLAATCSSVFPQLTCHYSATRMCELPGAPALASRTVAAIFTHLFHYPNLLVVFDERGTVMLWLPFAGAVFEPVVVPGAAQGELPLLVVPVEFHDLGQRLGVIAIPLLPNNGNLMGEFHAPPYDLPVRGIVSQRPMYATFAPEGRYADAVLERDGRVVLQRSGGGTLAFDGRTLVPLDGPDVAAGGASGGPFDPAAWLAAQRRLLEELEQTSRLSAQGWPAEGAQSLEAFARGPGLAPSQRGTALGQAAVLRRRAGDLPAALADARAAREAEPRIIGHQRLIIDALARTGTWADVEREFLSFDFGTVSVQEVQVDAATAALLLGRADKARTMIGLQLGGPLNPREENGDGAFLQALLALEAGAPDRVEALLAPLPWGRSYRPVALAAAIAAALRPGFDPALARHWIDAFRSGCGLSDDAPIVAVEALVAARSGTPGPTEAQLADALARQDAAGREHLLELLFARWAHRLADEARRSGTATVKR